MSMYKIAVIGDKDSVLGFKALGVAAFPVTSTEGASQVLRKLAREKYGIIFITEQVAEPLTDYIEELGTRLLPSVVMIPNNAGCGAGYAEDNAMKKAIGAISCLGKRVDNLSATGRIIKVAGPSWWPRAWMMPTCLMSSGQRRRPHR